MLGFLTKRSASPSYLRQARLSLEALETRYTPSSTSTLTAPLVESAPAQTSTAVATSITLNVAYGTGHTVILSGQVTDVSPAGLVVTFAGVVSGQATTDNNGNYQTTLTASALGDLSATVTGSDGVSQAVATATLQNAAPVISNFSAINGGNNIWTFTGTVSDEYAKGLTVTFSGGPSSMAGLTATVSADGTFSVTVRISSSTSGAATIGAQILSDWWGAASNITYTFITWTGSGRPFR